MKIILMGIQGSGKSTQGNLLSDKLGIPYLSTGHIFRQLAREKTKLGRYIKETMNAGYLIPDRRTIRIVNDYLSREEYKNGYILDGFPRTVTQVRAFTEKVDRVIFIKVSDEEALKRLTLRNGQVLREDDTEKAIKRRIELFYRFTKPVLEFYRAKGVLEEVDGGRTIDEIYQDIMSRLSLTLRPLV